ncbi:TrbI/VirB10 family protein [Novosphingobium clariflavum]|uniref:TrbI/VirB10 family protein n=1 Tax=Novosphingobium clariflavum TaxID=2029884 RepID=A0ABV6SCP4_9SPHN|nr:TrbI/VirB10 family protein [Novosphingobium clariflavum]
MSEEMDGGARAQPLRQPNPDGQPANESAAEAPARPVEKVDPETLAIRARPPRATRFRKEVIIGGTATATFALLGIAWFALSPRLTGHTVRPSDLSQPGKQAANDALNALPKGYGDVPKLGPPLPGDLGRPILRAQERDLGANLAVESQHRAAIDQERQKRADDLKNARQSALLAQGVRPGSATSAMSDVSQTALGATGSGSTPAPDPSATDRKVQFAEKFDGKGDINPHSVSRSSSPNVLMAGSVIAASLITGLNSDVPGMVVAQVTQSVFDSATGQVLLIPQGARLIGNYDSVVAYGQSRALVVWQRLVMPDGSSLRLDNMPATDSSGYAGLVDKVDYHTGRLLKGVAIATLLGVGTELSINGESDLVQAIRESAQTSASRAGDQITQRNLDIQPTITVRPGAPVRLVVRQDLVLEPWKGGNTR